MDWHDRIQINAEVLGGKPVIRASRVAVEFIVQLMSEGWSEAQILQNYPGITADDIKACLHYAAEMLREERVYPVPVKP